MSDSTVITIVGNQVQVTTPEGQTFSLPLDQFLALLCPARMDTGGVVLPQGVHIVRTAGRTTIWVCELPPNVYGLKWVTGDSPSQYGPGTTYRTVRLALPYVVLVAVFTPAENNHVQLSRVNECFFRNAPLTSLDDELFYPALLNCSKFAPPDGRPLSWVCTQYVNYGALARERDPAQRFRAGLEALRHCLFETGFNYSSEHHEASSWFSESRQVDPRLHTVEAWERASAKDRCFPLEVSWLKTGHTVGQVLDRIFRNVGAARQTYPNATALARLIVNHKPPPRS
jgi:hypothetical protein